MRTAMHWLTRKFLNLQADADGRRDAEDWLAGRDAEITRRRNARQRESILAAGGEIA